MDIPITLRPATPDDEPFQQALFVSWKAPELFLDLLPEDMRAPLLAMQWPIHRDGLATSFPAARREIILVDGTPAGAWAVERTAHAIHLREIALMPEYRGKGLAQSLIARLQAEAQATHQPLRLHVSRMNLPALSLYTRLGFQPEDDGGAQLPMVWVAGHPRGFF